VPEGTLPPDPVVGQNCVGPPVCVFDAMVVSAERCEVAFARLASIGNGDRMVDVAHDRRHPASRKDAGTVSGLNTPLLGRGGPSGSRTNMDRLACVVHHRVTPVRVLLPEGDLPCDVRNDGTVPGQFAWMVRESGEGRNVADDLYGASAIG